MKRVRTAAMELFLSDYTMGDERYRAAELPELPFENRTFDLALCSHLLFLYSEHLSADFHIRSILELCRIATEVRIFPLLELNLQKSKHLRVALSSLEKNGVDCLIQTVPYEFQKGGNEMLRCRSLSDEPEE